MDPLGRPPGYEVRELSLGSPGSYALDIGEEGQYSTEVWSNEKQNTWKVG